MPLYQQPASPTAHERATAAIRELRGAAFAFVVLAVLSLIGLIIGIVEQLAGTDVPDVLLAAWFGGLVSLMWFAAMARGIAALIELTRGPEPE